MPSIVSYQKVIDSLTTRELLLPEDPATHARIGTELCTIAGVTYVSLPDGAVLPAAQPAGIVPVAVVLTADLQAAIKAASPHVRLIDERVRTAIAERYSTSDEIKLLRTAPSPECVAYNAYVEDARVWGRAEKAKLGL